MNILFICTDQQSASAMSCAGNDELHTPAMDALAAAGSRYTRAYCTHPLCVPARASFMTGLMPHATGLTSNEGALNADLPPRSLPRLLADAGYRCALAGKWHVPGTTPEACGFDWLCRARDDQIPEVSAPFMAADDARPFFLFASFTNPHDVCQLARLQEPPQGPILRPATLEACPNLPANFERPAYAPELLDLHKPSMPAVYPTVHWDADDWRRLRHGYFRLVEKVDAEIGRLLEGLRASGKEHDTLVLFTSDHGDGHGAHRWNQKTALWEEVVNIPFIARGPGVAAARVSDRLVSNGLDLLPTLCDVAGVQPPDDVPGRSLLPLFADDAAPWRDELVVQTRLSLGGGPGAGSMPARALIGERDKYSVYGMGRHREQLVDLARDPGEMVNLAVETRHAERLQACRNRLRQACIADGDDAGVSVIP